MLISLDKIVKKFNLNIKGIIHIGAHYGQEYQTYLQQGIKNLIFFEPLKDNYKVLLSNIHVNTTVKAYNLALGNFTGTVKMNVEQANNGQSSSILEPELHLKQYPNIIFNKSEVVGITKLKNIDYDINQFNMINIDVQGYELEVFKGAEDRLNQIDIIYTEVNRDEVYKNCTRVEQLDEYLAVFGFSRILTSWDGKTWGDALYLKNYKVKEFTKAPFSQLIQKGYNYDRTLQLQDDWILMKSLYNNNYLQVKSTEVKIPKIIHQIWLGSDLPKRYKEFAETWKQYHPDWEYKLWLDIDAREFPMENRQLFELTKNLGSKSDILRYEILKKYGGLYIDTDFECLKSFNDLLYLKFFAGLSYDKNPQLCNGLIATIPNHPIIAMCVHNLPINLPIDGKKGSQIFNTTGPNYFTNQFKSMVDKNSIGIVVFPMDFFYSLPNNKIGNDPKPFITENSYCVHYWDVSWMPHKKVIYNRPPIIDQSFLHVR